MKSKKNEVALAAPEISMESRLKTLPELNENNQLHKIEIRLVEALDNIDCDKLQKILSSTTDQKVINFILQKVPLRQFDQLVSRLINLMQKNHINITLASNWLKVLIKLHSPQLMSLDCFELLEKFGPCIGAIENKLNCLTELSKLNGKLILLVSQIKRNSEEHGLNNENVLIYDDNLSENSDAENPDDENTSSEQSLSEWDEEDMEH